MRLTDEQVSVIHDTVAELLGEEAHVYPMVTGRNLLELTEGDA